MKVLVISVHPDDETLGCGGSLLRHGGEGDELHWLIVTSPHSPMWSREIVERKAGEVEAVAEAYGMKSLTRMGLPSAGLEGVPLGEIMSGIEGAVESLKPGCIYIVHGGDVHSDHQITSRAALSVLKPFRMRACGVQRLLSYETLSSTDAAAPTPGSAFLPNIYTDITPFVDRKVEIFNLYETEAQPDPMPRGTEAIRALARLRGATMGVNFAEAFMLIREVT